MHTSRTLNGTWRNCTEDRHSRPRHQREINSQLHATVSLHLQKEPSVASLLESKWVLAGPDVKKRKCPVSARDLIPPDQPTFHFTSRTESHSQNIFQEADNRSNDQQIPHILCSQNGVFLKFLEKKSVCVPPILRQFCISSPSLFISFTYCNNTTSYFSLGSSRLVGPLTYAPLHCPLV